MISSAAGYSFRFKRLLHWCFVFYWGFFSSIQLYLCSKKCFWTHLITIVPLSFPFFHVLGLIPVWQIKAKRHTTDDWEIIVIIYFCIMKGFYIVGIGLMHDYIWSPVFNVLHSHIFKIKDGLKVGCSAVFVWWFACF